MKLKNPRQHECQQQQYINFLSLLCCNQQIPMAASILYIKPQASAFASILMLVVSLFGYLFSVNYPSAKPLIIIVVSCLLLLWLTKCILISKYQIEILENNTTLLWHKRKARTAEIVKPCQITFLLTIITLKTLQNNITIPIFIDSTNIKQYKKLRARLLWN